MDKYESLSHTKWECKLEFPRFSGHYAKPA